MGLVDARAEVLHRQREVHGIEVVKIMAAKGEATDGNRTRQEREEHLLPVDHVWNEAIGGPS